MPTVGAAFDFLTTNGLEIFGPCTSLLYVGHRHDTSPWWYNTFAKNLGVTRLAVIDIDHSNLMSASHITSELYYGDIRQSDAPKGFDLVFWDEGPEHLPKEISLAVCTSLLAANHRRALISCPWGLQPQGSGPDDIEFHHWGPMPQDFESIGWKAATFGTMFDGHGSGHGNLIAWSNP